MIIGISWSHSVSRATNTVIPVECPDYNFGDCNMTVFQSITVNTDVGPTIDVSVDEDVFVFINALSGSTTTPSESRQIRTATTSA